MICTIIITFIIKMHFYLIFSYLNHIIKCSQPPILPQFLTLDMVIRL